MIEGGLNGKATVIGILLVRIRLRKIH